MTEIDDPRVVSYDRFMSLAASCGEQERRINELSRRIRDLRERLKEVDTAFKPTDHSLDLLTEIAEKHEKAIQELIERVKELETWRDEHSNLEQHLEPGV